MDCETSKSCIDLETSRNELSFGSTTISFRSISISNAQLSLATTSSSAMIEESEDDDDDDKEEEEEEDEDEQDQDQDDHQEVININYKPPNPIKMIPDGGWGWLIVFGSFIISLVTDGFSYTSGVFYQKFLHEYGQSESITSIFIAIMTGMISVMGPIAAGLAQTYGCRAVSISGALFAMAGMILSTIIDYNMYCHALTLGVLVGTGMGLMFLPQVTIVTEWFDRRLAFATGIAVCGSGFGMAFFALISDWLIEMFAWRGAMLILAGTMALCAISSATFIEPPYKQWQRRRQRQLPLKCSAKNKNNVKKTTTTTKTIDRSIMINSINHTNLDVKTLPLPSSIERISSTNNKNEKNKNKKTKTNNKATLIHRAIGEALNFSVMKDRTFLYFVIANSIGSVVYYVPMLITTDRVVRSEMGNTRDGATLMVFFGLANGLSRTGFGYISDWKNINRVFLYSAAVMSMGIIVAGTNLANTLASMQLLYIAFGITEGAHATLITVVLVDLFGIDHVYNTMGIVLMFDGIASMFGPPITNQLAQYDSTYTLTIWVCSGVTILSGAMIFVLPLLKSQFWMKHRDCCANRSNVVTSVDIMAASH
ncbi:hypothetical protein RDWZM_010228 [Blomia tropicalis]|uniref:Major facilitator superfamily (MFS) profile domain-containing protein n=1 Tax=Blomia tropicalis TaxID=40697 RepID=A0A9Q0LZ09_BLOTA|nr:hypothetical protein RDWZM_010228 [Blomia tropicalis]